MKKSLYYNCNSLFYQIAYNETIERNNSKSSKQIYVWKNNL